MTDAQELQAIGRRHGSDKWAGHFYAEPYASHFCPLRDMPLALLEIGVGGYDNPAEGGHSLRAWKEFFPNARICGLDFYDKSALAEERITLYRGSQADPRVVSNIMIDNPGKFDIIIDDGSHQNEHVVATFYMLWQHVKDFGMYVIEDLQTSYWPNHGGKLHDVHSPLTSMGFLKSLIDGLNWQEIHQPGYTSSSFDKEIVGIHFYHNIVFIQKGCNTEGSTEVAANRIRGV